MPTRYNIVFATATEQDALELAREMRPADREEAALMSGLSPEDAALRSLAVSDAAFSARLDGRLLCLFGAVRLSLADATAGGWMLCTPEVDRHPRAFLSRCREGFRLLSEALPDVRIWTNRVLYTHAAARRWLEWSGAWFSPSSEDVIGQLGGVFKSFSIDAADAAKER